MQRVQCNQLASQWWLVGGGWLVFSKAGAILGLSAYLCQIRATELKKIYIWIHVYILPQSHDYSIHQPIVPAYCIISDMIINDTG